MTQPMTKTLMKVMADSAAIEKGVAMPPAYSLLLLLIVLSSNFYGNCKI
jgi:hypothetical protein